jgi:hypothetical protein
MAPAVWQQATRANVRLPLQHMRPSLEENGCSSAECLQAVPCCRDSACEDRRRAAVTAAANHLPFQLHIQPTSAYTCVGTVYTRLPMPRAHTQ